MLLTQQWDEVYQLLSWWDAEKVKAARVMVVGAGALGNEVLKNLALLNTGHIYIIDFDNIEYSNLSRSILFRESDVGQPKAATAAQRLREINPNCDVQYIHGDAAFDVGLGVFRRMDVIIGCLDNRIARLYINRHAHKLNKTWINGGILNLSGVLDVFRPGSSCYECQLRKAELGIIRYRIGCTDIAKRNANAGRLPTTPISASIIGAMQVQEAFKILYGNEEASLAGKRFFYDGESNEMLFYTASSSKPFCQSHGRIEDIIEAPSLSANSTVADLLSWLDQQFPDRNFSIPFDDYDLVVELYSEEKKQTYEVMLPRFRISNKVLNEYRSSPQDKIGIPRENNIRYIDKAFPKPQMKLSEIGIPALHILTVEMGEEVRFVELSKDVEQLFSNDMNPESKIEN